MGVNPNHTSSPVPWPEAGARRGKPPVSAQVSAGAEGKAKKPGESRRNPSRASNVPARGWPAQGWPRYYPALFSFGFCCAMGVLAGPLWLAGAPAVLGLAAWRGWPS